MGLSRRPGAAWTASAAASVSTPSPSSRISSVSGVITVLSLRSCIQVLLIRYFESELYAPIAALSIIRLGGFQTPSFDVPYPATCRRRKDVPQRANPRARREARVGVAEISAVV